MGLQLQNTRTLIADHSFWPRAAILVGVAATITMNITGGLADGPGAAILAALIPIGFVIGLETEIVLLRRCGLPWWGIVLASVPLAALAGLTGVVSWLHGHQVALETNNPPIIALLIPFIPDLMILCGSVVLVALKVTAKIKAGAPRNPDHRQPNPRQPKPRKTPQAAPKPPPVISAKVLAHLSPEQIRLEEKTAAQLALLPIPDFPSERELAAAHFNNSRPAARRTLARALAIKHGQQLTVVNGTSKEH